ncbi:hypothetical protein D3C78_1324390 [compost metagenome]
MIEQGDHILAQILKPQRKRWQRCGTVPALVIAQDVKALNQHRQLRLPHVEGGTERVGQHQQRRSGVAIKAIVDIHAVSPSHTRSIISAMPWPTPIHIVHKP